MTEQALEIAQVARFWEKVRKGEGCWEWIAHRHFQGYGLINVSGKTKKAHRISWVITNGPIPKGMCVLHRCDNPPCVNPDHLFLGTQVENIRDMVRKGRQRAHAFRGEENPMAVLTEEAVESMRVLRQTEGTPYKKLGEIFNVSTMTAFRATTKQSWRAL